MDQDPIFSQRPPRRRPHAVFDLIHGRDDVDPWTGEVVRDRSCPLGPNGLPSFTHRTWPSRRPITPEEKDWGA
jgi:hypothetical protein